ncbi:MAG: PAS domain-containing protein, partial [Acidimicrobiales bacterium]|nr:PAS domain-containing protein [Acidimicrobiales bacterium]
MALPISGTRAAVAPSGEHAVLSAVVDACPTGALVVEFDGRLVQANPSARQLLGLDANRLLVAYSTDYLQLAPRLRQLRDGDAPSIQLVQRVVRPDGQPLWVEFHLVGLAGNNPERPLAAVFLTDRTRIHLQERTMRAQVAGLDLALSQARVAVVVTDGRERVVRWSPGAELLFGTADRNAEGRLLSELIDVE